MRVVPTGESAPFELRARSTQPLATAVPLRAPRRDGDWLRAEYVRPPRPMPRTRTALLELSSVLGRVVSSRERPAAELPPELA